MKQDNELENDKLNIANNNMSIAEIDDLKKRINDLNMGNKRKIYRYVDYLLTGNDMLYKILLLDDDKTIQLMEFIRQLEKKEEKPKKYKRI